MAKNSRHPHPLISCGKKFKDDEGHAKEHVRKLITPIFEKVLKETKKNPTSVGVAGCITPKITLYKPHNYRLYIDFETKTFTPPKQQGLLSNQGGGSVLYTIKNSKDHSFENFLSCRLVVRRKTIEVNNQIDHERWYPIKHTDPGDIERQIKDIVQQKDNECFRVLNAFINEFGGFSKFEIGNALSEDKLMQEDSINLIDYKMKFHTPVVKKVYSARNVEFSNPVFVSNYLTNRALEDFAPEIAYAINNLAETLKLPLERMKSCINSYADILKFKDAISCLSFDECYDLSLWISYKFGGDISGEN